MPRSPVSGVGAIPSLRILARDPASYGQHQEPVGQRWLDVDGHLVATGAVKNGRWLMDWPGLGTYRFGPFGDVEVVPAAGASDAALRDSFIRGVLPEVLVAREHEALHGSAVIMGGRLVAFCALSGAGKSSLALGLASRGGSHWADDTVLIAGDVLPATAVCLPFPARVDPPAREALNLQSASVPQSSPGDTAALDAVYVLLRDSACDPRFPQIEDLSAAGLFQHLLAHAHPFELADGDRRRRMLERLLRIASESRGFQLRFGPSLDSLPTLVDSVERHFQAN